VSEQSALLGKQPEQTAWEYGGVESGAREPDEEKEERDSEEFAETVAELVEIPEESVQRRKKERRPMTKALPPFLRPYIEHVAILVCISFLTIFVFTIWVDIEAGSTDD
jgi:hypothetical protein